MAKARQGDAKTKRPRRSPRTPPPPPPRASATSCLPARCDARADPREGRGGPGPGDSHAEVADRVPQSRGGARVDDRFTYVPSSYCTYVYCIFILSTTVRKISPRGHRSTFDVEWPPHVVSDAPDPSQTEALDASPLACRPAPARAGGERRRHRRARPARGGGGARRALRRVRLRARRGEERSASHAINIHAPVSAEPRWRRARRGARAFACGGGATPADCAMLALDVLFADDGDARASDVVVSGVNRGENCGRHDRCTAARWPPREGAMRADAVGVAVSLDSYARDASYDHAARRARASWRPSCWARTTPMLRALRD